MRVNVFYEKENKKELCFLISTCSRINLFENIPLNKCSLHLIITTNKFVLELFQCSKLSKLNPTMDINVS